MFKQVLLSFVEKAEIYYAINQIEKCGFWFIDIPRTSSSSIKAEFGKTYGRAYAKHNLIETEYSKRSIFPDHLTAQEMRNILGKEIWDKIFTFTFVRNPWDRIASLFFYRKKVNRIPQEMTFRDYIFQFISPRYKGKNSVHSYHVFYYSAAEYVLDEDDNVIIDFIGKYENRSEDLKKIAEKINYLDLGKLRLQKAKPSNKHYSEYYDDETREIIETVYRKDIDLFGYTFEHRS